MVSRFFLLSVAAFPVLSANAAPVRDAMACPALKNVRLGGYPGAKLNDLIRERVTSLFAREEVFGEARRAFVDRDDDIKGHGGLWRGEFWGKLMLSASRVADYLNDPEYIKWIGEECRRLMDTADDDGYIGSYSNKDLVSITDPEATRKAYGWLPVWNIWNRKYAMWGMLMAYKVTHDKAILLSVERQMDQLINMLRRKGLRLHDTGTPSMNGLPSMSILKPLVLLHEETGKRKYLDFAAEMLSDWDREDDGAPNFFRNAKKPIPIHNWYPKPEDWAKSYEFMSCIDGLLEYYRATGDRRCLETAQAIRDNLAETEANPLGAVGYGDKLIGATKCINALNEVCDVIHWIRLNLDLYLITGDKKHLDSIETAYFNAYLAGIYRGGRWGPFFLRGNCRHQDQRQCGCAYQHCCVNNLPRTFMDIASAVVTRDASETYHVNFYADAKVELDGVRFEISGNYPVGSVVRVAVSKPVEVKFHRPAWCPEMDVSRDAKGYVLSFDMNPRILERAKKIDPRNCKDEKMWAFRRYREHWSAQVNRDAQAAYRTVPAALVMWGPLVLVKTCLVPGTSRNAVDDSSTVNGEGYTLAVTPSASSGKTWGTWNVEMVKEGHRTVKCRVADYASGTDVPVGEGANLFSIWF